jgi:hypothetical protein
MEVERKMNIENKEKEQVKQKENTETRIGRNIDFDGTQTYRFLNGE